MIVGPNPLAAAGEARFHTLFGDASPQSYHGGLTWCRCGTTKRETNGNKPKGVKALELDAPQVLYIGFILALRSWHNYPCSMHVHFWRRCTKMNICGPVTELKTRTLIKNYKCISTHTYMQIHIHLNIYINIHAKNWLLVILNLFFKVQYYKGSFMLMHVHNWFLIMCYTQLWNWDVFIYLFML